MNDLDNGPTPDEIRHYGSHVGFAWAVRGQTDGIGTPHAASAIQLAVTATDSPLASLLEDEADLAVLMEHVATAIMGHSNDDAETTRQFWREVAHAVGMSDCDGIPHKTEFVRGFLEAQFIVLAQNTYHASPFDQAFDLSTAPIHH